MVQNTSTVYNADDTTITLQNDEKSFKVTTILKKFEICSGLIKLGENAINKAEGEDLRW
jgi:hypothetical protein